MKKIITTALLALCALVGEAACSSNLSPRSPDGHYYEPLSDDPCEREFQVANRSIRATNRKVDRANELLARLIELRKAEDSSREELCDVLDESLRLEKEMADDYKETGEMWESAAEMCTGKDVALASDGADTSREGRASSLSTVAKIENEIAAKCH